MPVDSDDLTKVMMDFYQRMTKSTPEYRPQLGTVEKAEYRYRDSDGVHGTPPKRDYVVTPQQQALVAPENQFDMINVSLVVVPPNRWQQTLTLGCHNPGHIAMNAWQIPVLMGTWACLSPFVTPNSGTLQIGFNTDRWVPPPFGQPPVVLDFGMTPVPQPTSTQHGSFLGTLVVELTMIKFGTNEFVNQIFGTWPWTPGNPGFVTLTLTVFFVF